MLFYVFFNFEVIIPKTKVNIQIDLFIFYVLECATLHDMIKGLQHTIESQHNLKGKLEKK